MVAGVLPRFASMSIVTSATLFTSHCLVQTLDRREHLLRRLALRLSIGNQEVRQLELPSALAPVGIRYCGRNSGRLAVVPAPTERTGERKRVVEGRSGPVLDKPGRGRCMKKKTKR